MADRWWVEWSVRRRGPISLKISKRNVNSSACMNERQKENGKSELFSVAENWKYIAKYLGFNASLASPCSSYDSSETFQSENFEYESPTNGTSPSMKGNHDNPTSPHTETSNDSRMLSNQLMQEKSSNEQSSVFKSDRKRSESDYNSRRYKRMTI